MQKGIHAEDSRYERKESRKETLQSHSRGTGLLDADVVVDVSVVGIVVREDNGLG